MVVVQGGGDDPQVAAAGRGGKTTALATIARHCQAYQILQVDICTVHSYVYCYERVYVH